MPPPPTAAGNAEAGAQQWAVAKGQLKWLDDQVTRWRRKVGPEVGPPSAFYRCVPTGMHGPTCVFWADLTAFSLQMLAAGSPDFITGECSIFTTLLNLHNPYLSL